MGGHKGWISGELVHRCLEQGISVASLNCRLAQQSPYPAPMLDCAGRRGRTRLEARASGHGKAAAQLFAGGTLGPVELSR